ncbi:MAG: ABC transporter ATP-binding protein [Gammaproteobacteria bacterium]|nr:ABC transporter ATP-binding protein [Gammaproteobacteria bacterium]
MSEAISATGSPDERSTLSPRELGRLVLRTWPYMRPQLRHLVAWIVARYALELVFLVATLIAFDLFNNKILLGEKLQHDQAVLLQLDESYVRALDTLGVDAEEEAAPHDALFDDADDVERPLDPAVTMDTEQRRVVRNRLGVVFAIAAVLFFLLGPTIDYYRTWILQRVNQYLRVTMMERAEHLSLRYHSHARTGDAIYRIYQDSAMITSVIERAVLEPVVAVGHVVFSFLVIWLFSPILGGVYLAGMLPILMLVVWFTPRLQIRSRRARTANGALTSRIQEAFAAIRIVKANRAERVMGSRFDGDSQMALDAAFYLRMEFILMRVLAVVIAGAMIIGTQYLMAGWTIAETPTFLAGAVALVGFSVWNLGTFQAANGRNGEFVEAGSELIGMWGVIQDMGVGLDRAFFLLDLKPDIVDANDAVPLPAPIREIRFDGVAFGYDPAQPVLNGIDLKAEPGTITAIVGGTGSGKSTLMSLLLRLYDPDAGTIRINGVPLTGIRMESLRAGVAIALQQNTLFATTVADNIAYAKADASRRAIESAARVSCADAFIREMAQGYDTELGERGGKLSTGQRQRLSIARAIVRDTPILILDEPTASLDAETEHAVLENLSDWGRERIVFLITHRLSTIRNADQIAFLEDGEIRELGDHESLMSIPDGRYRRYVNAQVQIDAPELPE